MEFTGTWHIYEMETWDKGYFNLVVGAYIKITSNNRGDFQFGLVYGSIAGKVIEHTTGKLFKFTWVGFDESSLVYGSGWVRIKEKGLLEGEFTFHDGDSSVFLARRGK